MPALSGLRASWCSSAVYEVAPGEAEALDPALRRDALVGEVVHGEDEARADIRVRLAALSVDGREARLPVVRVDDVGGRAEDERRGAEGEAGERGEWSGLSSKAPPPGAS